MEAVLYLTSLVCALYLSGLIWTIQVAHYPLFAAVPSEAFKGYEERHVRRMLVIVFVPMVAELISALALLAYAPSWFPAWAAWSSAALAGLVWLSTALVQVPCHKALETHGFDARVHARLVATNWVRTLAWSARSAVLLWPLAELLSAWE